MQPMLEKFAALLDEDGRPTYAIAAKLLRLAVNLLDGEGVAF